MYLKSNEYTVQNSDRNLVIQSLGPLLDIKHDRFVYVTAFLSNKATLLFEMPVNMSVRLAVRNSAEKT